MRIAVLLVLFIFPMALRATPPEEVFSKYRAFRIPFQVPAETKEMCKELRLFVSTDRGKTWRLHESVTLDRLYFRFSTPQDGTYWFNVQTVAKNGKLEPGTFAKRPPDLKVRIEALRQP